MIPIGTPPSFCCRCRAKKYATAEEFAAVSGSIATHGCATASSCGKSATLREISVRRIFGYLAAAISASA